MDGRSPASPDAREHWFFPLDLGSLGEMLSASILPGRRSEHRDTVTEWELPAGTFFDIAVIHVLTTATIDRLRDLYPEGRFEVRRFRPNIVVSTGPDAQGFVENDWIDRTIAIGDEVRLRVTGPCPRCVMITLEQGDLPRDVGILRTAAQHSQANVGVYADVRAA
jgi:uncharacterized protein YcbX